mgnify:CR=1 FL=1
MAIEPNTTIKVYRNVPLDISQDRSIAWANLSEQIMYFHNPEDPSGILIHSFANSTYQRVNRGRMRVEYSADDLYEANYLAFQNTNYGNKWFYAFVTSVEYVNDITSEITYELDDFQTWYFEMDLQPSMIERCHTPTDVIGQHIEPEPVVLGEYVFNNKTVGGQVIESYGPMRDLSELCIVVAYVDVEQNIVAGRVYDGVYGGATLRVFNLNDYTSLNTFLEHWLVIPDSILGIYMIPANLINYPIPQGGMQIENNYKSTPRVVDWHPIDATYDLDGYHPHNKKLYTYPYNFVQVDNANGSILKLRYEFFKNLTPCFEVVGTVTNPVEIMLRPYNYRNCTYGSTSTADHKALNTETLSINMYPLCSWAYDGFQAWMVNTGIPYGINLVGGAIDAITSPGFGGYNGGVVPQKQSGKMSPDYKYEGVSGGGMGGLASGFLNTYYSALTVGQQDIIKGNYSCGGVNCAMGKQQFYGGRVSITHQYAEVIDNFFDMYGYTCMKIQTPNLRARPHWTYIKTRECNLKGDVPAISKQNIKNMFNKGMTFWKVPSEVGNYSLSNVV